VVHTMQKRWLQAMKNCCCQKCLNMNHHLMNNSGRRLSHQFQMVIQRWCSSNITLLRLLTLSRDKHRRYSNWNNTLNYLLVLSVCYKAHFHNQLNLALCWSLITTETWGEITEIWWLEGRQIEVGLWNWGQIK
jgi:hypothetical protein